MVLLGFNVTGQMVLEGPKIVGCQVCRLILLREAGVFSQSLLISLAPKNSIDCHKSVYLIV